MGDPIEYRIWGYELTLRKDDGAKIEIELVEKREGKKETGEHKSSNFTNHPHIGESGIYHVKQRGETIEKGQLITFGLAGIVERLLCLISLQALISMWGIFRELR